MTGDSPIAAILLDTDEVLYHHPRRQRHLLAFLAAHGYAVRDAVVVERGLRAARMDVQSGRISCDTFYDALLRMHGVSDPDLLTAGRTALYADAADLELFPGVAETLARLQQAGYRLGTVAFTPHSAGITIGWLVARGLSLNLWTVFLASPDIGHVVTPGTLFEYALRALNLPAPQVVYVGHESEALLQAADLGLVTVAFMPDDPGVETRYTIGSFYGLADLFLPRPGL